MDKRVRVALLLGALAAAPGARAQAVWVTGYYPGWRQSRLPPRDIDYDAVTLLMHFSVVPRPDGTLNAAVNLLTPANVKEAVSAAHDAGKRILVTVGGRGTREGFEGALSGSHRRAFVDNLVRFMSDNGYDGIDVDMEDMAPRDDRDYALFIRDLRKRLNRILPRPLLTAAVLWEPALFAKLSGDFDQINLMSYNLSGPYPGWVVWHNGALFDGGQRFPNGRASLPSVNGLADSFLAAGVPKRKLGVGISFDGYVWSGGQVCRPRQAWITPPAVKNVPYYALAETYNIKEYDAKTPGYHWDDTAQAAYLSIEASAPSGPLFVSYDNEVTAEKAVRYVRTKGLGGLIVWDLGAGYRPEQPPDRRDLLLKAVKWARLDDREAGR